MVGYLDVQSANVLESKRGRADFGAQVYQYRHRRPQWGDPSSCIGCHIFVLVPLTNKHRNIGEEGLGSTYTPFITQLGVECQSL